MSCVFCCRAACVPMPLRCRVWFCRSELNRLRSSNNKQQQQQHAEPLTLTISKDGIYDLSVSSGSTGTEFAQCMPGRFMVSQAAVERAIRSLDPHQALPPLNFSADKVCLRCLDMLTYPRPVRKFKVRAVLPSFLFRSENATDLRQMLPPMPADRRAASHAVGLAELAGGGRRHQRGRFSADD